MRFASVLAGVAVVGVVSTGMVGISHGVVNERVYVAGKSELVIDGTSSGFVSAFAGGSPYADVVSERIGTSNGPPKKSISAIHYDPISLRFGAGMSKGTYAWMKDALERRPGRKNGAIELLDVDLKEQTKVTFTNALIGEIAFPAVDSASKDAAFFSVTLVPETTRRAAGSKQVIANHAADQTKYKWMGGNFKLAIDGLDTTRVSKVDALVFTQSTATYSAGETRNLTTVPTTLTLPNLGITIAEADAASFYAWFDDFVIRGNNGDDKEKNGSLDYLSPDMKSLFTLNFKHIGIFKMTSATVEAGDTIRRVKIDLYFEEVTFTASPTATF